MARKVKKIEIVLNQEEYEYLRGLIEAEVFQLSGIVKIKKNVPEKKELNIAEKIENQLSGVSFQPA